MAIKMQAEPSGGREMLHAALAARLHRAPQLPPLQGAVQTGAPLPVYLIDEADAAGTSPLGSARQIGWRYPIVGGASAGLAFLRDTSVGLTFAGLAHGGLPQRLLDAALLSEDNLGARTTTYQPRLLEIPSLRLCALWLAASDQEDLFVLLLDGHQTSDALLQIERDMKPHITAAHVRRKGHAPVPRAALTIANDDMRRYGDKFWDMANAITGFAALQGAAVALINWHTIAHNTRAIYTATILEATAALLYLLSVRTMEKYHLLCVGNPSALSRMFAMISVGRKFVIIWFGLLSWLALFGGYDAK